MSNISFSARIDPLASTNIEPNSWFITFGLGGPAEGSFTEVTFGPGEPADLTDIIDQVVRQVAFDTYGTAWAFHYSPDQYDSAIERWSLWRRERIVVEGIEVYS